MLDTPTWRANLDWGARLGYDAIRLAARQPRAVEFVRELAADGPDVRPSRRRRRASARAATATSSATTMSAPEAAAYHGLQARAFAEAGADMITAVTMTYADEAIGVAARPRRCGLPGRDLVHGRDRRRPAVGRAARRRASPRSTTRPDGVPAYYMVNCAHPTHFAEPAHEPARRGCERVKAIRANASRCSHAELDEATELDRGDVADLAAWYGELRSILPDLRVVGGCCGTDHEHVTAIATALRR